MEKKENIKTALITAAVVASVTASCTSVFLSMRATNGVAEYTEKKAQLSNALQAQGDTEFTRPNEVQTGNPMQITLTDGSFTLNTSDIPFMHNGEVVQISAEGLSNLTMQNNYMQADVNGYHVSVFATDALPDFNTISEHLSGSFVVVQNVSSQSAINVMVSGEDETEQERIAQMIASSAKLIANENKINICGFDFPVTENTDLVIQKDAISLGYADNKIGFSPIKYAASTAAFSDTVTFNNGMELKCKKDFDENLYIWESESGKMMVCVEPVTTDVPEE